MKVADALHRLIIDVALTPRQRDEADRQRKVVHGHLARGLSVKESLISGSVGRRTAIRPLNDIDLFLTLNRDAHEDLRSGDPDACLRKIQSILHVAYPNKGRPRLQKRSINIEFSTTGLGFDVVPAFQDPWNTAVYEIPDRNTRGWIRTNPRVHRDYSRQADQRAGSKANPLVKLLKHWNNTRPGKKPMRSFHLELMVYEALTSPPADFAEGLALLFKDLAERVMRPCADPARLVGDVSAGFSPERRQRAQRMLREAAGTAQRAVEADKAHRTAEAHYLWRSILGDAYPERG